MLPTLYNYGSWLRGDTVSERTFTLNRVVDGVTTPLDLSTATIRCEFRLDTTRKMLFTIGSGIDNSNAAIGEFTIEKFNAQWVGLYRYDIEITFADGTIRTYIYGTLDIQNDATI